MADLPNPAQARGINNRWYEITGRARAPFVDRIQFESDDLEYPRLAYEPFRPETLGRRPGEKAGDDYCDTLDEVAKKKPAELSAQQKVGAELVRQARPWSVRPAKTRRNRGTSRTGCGSGWRRSSGH
jgi:hypothetical protein